MRTGSDHVRTPRHRDLIFTNAAHVDSRNFAAASCSPTAPSRAAPRRRGAKPSSGTSTTRSCFYPDGTPRTRHLTSNVRGHVDEAAGTATAHSYWTALQAAPGLPLQPIASGHYDDRFERSDGVWHFVERRPRVAPAGDLSHHFKAA
ncbi:nuclear transport factor 2 family protein [Amycolatopsis sp. NPDC023774]|uniref:nuclear transport factor 2 family protein n=1 Tax=Amycolatopsis sp. NPDC023774 TaxID=3155015 RepID=UPI0033C26D1E